MCTILNLLYKMYTKYVQNIYKICQTYYLICFLRFESSQTCCSGIWNCASPWFQSLNFVVRAHTALTKKAYLKTNRKNSNKQIMMLEKYLRRVGAMRRSENVALLLEKNPNHRLHWKGLDPRWRWHRSLAANRAKRVVTWYLT